MSEESKLTAKIMLAIILFLAVVFILFHKASAKPIQHKDEECHDTLEKPWDVCWDHNEAYACKKYCGKTVTMQKGTLVIR